MNRQISKGAGWSIILAVVAACGGGNGDMSGPDPGPPNPPTNSSVSFKDDVQPIFSANCALSGCHLPPNPQQGQNLSTGVAFFNIVNVPSRELPSMNRVTPGDPNNSYLAHKIRGTQNSVGGSGATMPIGGVLSAAEINTIVAWIQQGALNN